MDSDDTQAAADRLGDKLTALDLDDDERAVLEAVLGAGATSAVPVGGEVEGFAFDASLGSGGGTRRPVPSVAPAESLSLSFGTIKWTYTQQKPEGSAPEK